MHTVYKWLCILYCAATVATVAAAAAAFIVHFVAWINHESLHV